MENVVEIRPLAREDERGGFSYGQPDLDRFFEHYAGQNQFKLHLRKRLPSYPLPVLRLARLGVDTALAAWALARPSHVGAAR